jgi:hypothetical protein
VTGQGLDQLIRRIVEVLVPDVPPPGAAVPSSNACMATIEMLRRSIIA